MNLVAVRRVCIPESSTVSHVDAHTHPPAVLVALADANLRAAASRVLARAGYRVLTASHSGHALLACLTGGRIDVLLSDLRMDDDSGRALAERLRRHNPDLRGLYFSNNPVDAAADVLVNPVTADDLLQALERDCQREL
jgi:CheY-like chemotaxis protein